MKPKRFTQFTFGDKKYTIINELNTNDAQWKYTNVFRTRKVFAWRPYWIGDKFRWLKSIYIKEQFIFFRCLEFDDGWTYRYYWGKWSSYWEGVEILDK